MVTNFSVFWRPFRGYFINLFDCGSYLINKLAFYDHYGNLVNVPLHDGVGFWCSLQGDININVRKKENYTRNEIFVIKRPKKYGEVVYDAYIPMGAANLKHIGECKKVSGDGNYISYYSEYTFRGSNLEFWSGDKPTDPTMATEDENTLKMAVYTNYGHTEKKQKLDELAADVKATSGVDISSYDLERILEHYTIIKK